MYQHLKKIENSLSNFDALASHLLRFGIAIAFIIHGLNKFPLPPEALIEYFDLSPFLASFVAISELSAGAILLISGFIRSPYGSILTRMARTPKGHLHIVPGAYHEIFLETKEVQEDVWQKVDDFLETNLGEETSQ